MKAFSSQAAPNSRKLVGFGGQKFVERDLVRKKCRILDLNFHSKFGEIDIVANIGTAILFVEVKTMNYKQDNELFEVSGKQIERILKTAEFWLLNNSQFCEFERYYVLALVKNGIVTYKKLL